MAIWTALNGSIDEATPKLALSVTYVHHLRQVAIGIPEE